MANLLVTVQNWFVNLLEDSISDHPNQTLDPIRSYFQGEATVAETIHPQRQGRVIFYGATWPARCLAETSLPEGNLVQVVGVRNITLLVKPLDESGIGDVK